MSNGTYLVTVSGPDRVGVGAQLFAALRSIEQSPVRLLDVAQITIRGTLVLCAEVSAVEGFDVSALESVLAAQSIETRGVHVRVEPVTLEAAPAGRRLLVTLLAPQISATQLEAVFHAFAEAEATCERIVHLASYPVDCYELIVLGERHHELRLRLTEVADETGLDVAVQRAGLHRRSKHLVVMDADSTLIQDEVIDLLGEASGRRDEVTAITAAAMGGHLDFAEALRQRVALLAGLPVSILDEVRDQLRLAPGARTLVRTLRRLGYVPAVVSGGFEEVLAPILEELGVDHYAANHLEIGDGHLTGRVTGEIVDRAGKARALARFAEEVGVPLEQTVAVGDGANDIDMLALAGLGVAFNAKALVQAHADTALSVPYLDAVLYFLGISREEIEDDASPPKGPA